MAETTSTVFGDRRLVFGRQGPARAVAQPHLATARQHAVELRVGAEIDVGEARAVEHGRHLEALVGLEVGAVVQQDLQVDRAAVLVDVDVAVQHLRQIGEVGLTDVPCRPGSPASGRIRQIGAAVQQHRGFRAVEPVSQYANADQQAGHQSSRCSNWARSTSIAAVAPQIRWRP